MSTRKIRATMVVATLVLAMAPELIARAATTSPGTLRIVSPTPATYHSGTMLVSWAWKSGSTIKSTSKIDAFVTSNGFSWTQIGTNVPIRRGALEFDTTAFGDSLYAVRIRVRGTTIERTVSPFVIDNTAPEVKVTRPAPTELIVDDQTLASQRYIIGTYTLGSESRDQLSGVESIVWSVDDEEICDTDCTYNFADFAGERTLTVTATDRAGNSSSASVDVMIVPGPSAVGDPTLPDPPEPGDAPELPDPGESPEVPDLPEMPEQPEPPEAPDLGETPDPGTPPDPSTLPVPIPTP